MRYTKELYPIGTKFLVIRAGSYQNASYNPGEVWEIADDVYDLSQVISVKRKGKRSMLYIDGSSKEAIPLEKNMDIGHDLIKQMDYSCLEDYHGCYVEGAFEGRKFSGELAWEHSTGNCYVLQNVFPNCSYSGSMKGYKYCAILLRNSDVPQYFRNVLSFIRISLASVEAVNTLAWEDLVDGFEVTFRNGNDSCPGVISVEGQEVYVCQNLINGASCTDKKGKLYSWLVVRTTYKEYVFPKRKDKTEEKKISDMPKLEKTISWEPYPGMPVMMTEDYVYIKKGDIVVLEKEKIYGRFWYVKHSVSMAPPLSRMRPLTSKEFEEYSESIEKKSTPEIAKKEPEPDVCIKEKPIEDPHILPMVDLINVQKQTINKQILIL